MAVETLEQSKAFQVYYAMGSERSYDKVASSLGKHRNTILKWGKRFRWQERIDETNALVTADMDKSLVKATIDTKEQSKMISQMLRDQFQEAVSSGDVKVRSVKEFVTIDKHDLLVRGEATERKEVRSIEIRGEAKDMLEYIGKHVEDMDESEEMDIIDSVITDAEEEDR